MADKYNKHYAPRIVDRIACDGMLGRMASL